MRPVPNEPTRRRIVIVLDETDYERLEYDDSTELSKRPDVAIMKWPPEQADAVAMRIASEGATPGSILLQSPFDTDSYAPESEAADIFALQKVAIFSRLCQLLGAKKVQVEVLEDDKRHRKYHAEVKGGKGPIKASSETERDSFDNVASNISWLDTYAGGPADSAAARALLSRHNLESDSTLRSLVDASEDVSNLQRARRLTIDLSKDSKQTLRIAADLAIPVSLSGSATFTREFTSQARYRVSYDVLF